jgi:hypothetical protein
LNSTGKRAASPDAAIDEATVITDGADEPSLARDMIEVHGAEAATVARNNARAAALGGQRLRAKFWIRVLGLIQRQQAGKAMPPRGLGNSLPSVPAPNSTQG